MLMQGGVEITFWQDSYSRGRGGEESARNDMGGIKVKMARKIA